MKTADDVRKELLGEFRATAKQRLERIANTWIALEQAEAVGATTQLLGELHSLKGESRMMGFLGAAQLLHHAEEVVAVVGERGREALSAVGDTVLVIVDAVGARLFGGAAEDNPDAPAVLALVERCKQAIVAIGADTGQTTRAMAPPKGAEVAESEARATREVRTEALASFSESSRELLASHVRYDVMLRGLEHEIAEVGATLKRNTAVNSREQDRLTQILEAVRTLREEVHQGHLEAERLEERAIALRLVPLQTLFTRYVRPVRDLARELGKDCALEIEGGELTVDRQIIDRLAEPLLHLLRNAVDHGLEAPAARQAAGKSQRGTILVTARLLGGRVQITLSDDGRGIDLEAVRRRGIERGLLTPAEARSAPHDRLVGLLFAPGFTTRTTATETSGRGVGLDVVKRTIDELGGQLSVVSTPGHGMRVDLVVPTSLSLTRLLLVRASGRTFAIPSSAVHSVSTVEPRDTKEIGGHTTVTFGDGRLLLVPLVELFGEPRAPTERALILDIEGRKVALGVEEWADELELVIKPLPDVLTKSRLALGAAVVGSGALAVVLNPSELISRALGERPDVHVGNERASARERVQRRRILLAEDSVITRTMLSRLIAAFGYDVREAENGARALELLQVERFDLLLTDLDMPEVTGFELTERVRKIPELARLPIVVLTTRGAAEDKARAARAGADSYLVKTSFSESELREALERHLR